ncbi:MAG: LPD29 domain-containing protein [Pseudolysinimonas sp.]|uniref:LPD29 domain-containing protein n=1 Tax=Pseudolysinimonas sp. TaxID=2680009 RepID=UPI003265C27D
MTRYISTKETAAMLRRDLAKAWPGVKFSVRMATGTASAWIDVRYIDGPTWREVRAFTGEYQGRDFNGMTDSYDEIEPVLAVLPGNELPEVIHFSCDGINSHREYSPAARLFAQQIIADAGHGDIQTCTPEGAPLHRGDVPHDVAIGGKVYSDLYSPAGLAERILGDLDLSLITT